MSSQVWDEAAYVYAQSVCKLLLSCIITDHSAVLSQAAPVIESKWNVMYDSRRDAFCRYPGIRSVQAPSRRGPDHQTHSWPDHPSRTAASHHWTANPWRGEDHPEGLRRLQEINLIKFHTHKHQLGAVSHWKIYGYIEHIYASGSRICQGSYNVVHAFLNLRNIKYKFQEEFIVSQTARFGYVRLRYIYWRR